MRGLTSFLICVVATTLSGCLIVPEGRHTDSGQDYSREAIAFLGEPGVTRKEAIATLGLPTWEYPQWGVIVYSWYSGQRWHFLPTEEAAAVGIHESHPETGKQHLALLIAYNKKGIVTAHTVREIGNASLENVCAEWSRSLTGVRSSGVRGSAEMPSRFPSWDRREEAVMARYQDR